MFATPSRNDNFSVRPAKKHVFYHSFLIQLPPLPHETLIFRARRGPNRPHFDPKLAQMAPRSLGAPCFTMVSDGHLRHSAAKRSFLPPGSPESQHLSRETHLFRKSGAPLERNEADTFYHGHLRPRTPSKGQKIFQEPCVLR